MTDLTSQYTKKLQQFYAKRGFVPGYHNISQHRDCMYELMNEHNMSLKDAFVQFTKIYKDPEQMLKEIYYDLFGSLIYNKLERHEFDMIDYNSKAQLVFKKVPGFMKNRFQLYHFGFLAIHFADKKVAESLDKSQKLDKDSFSIIKKYLF